MHFITASEVNMAKKSAFLVFLNCHRIDEIKKGNKNPCFKELSTKLTPVWNAMNDNDKKMYKDLAHEYNSSLVENQPIKQISDVQNYSNDFWNMQKYLTKMFECIPNHTELLDKKFFLLHINCHTLDEEQYYFPAEIAALEFSLKNGLSRTYHQVIGISKIYPRGFAGGMREFSDKFHQISCFNEHPDDYQKILLEFSTFLKDGVINQADLQEGTLDLPYLFTTETEVGTNIMNTKNSLERLYCMAFPKVGAERAKSIFKIGSTEKLLFEIQRKFNLHLDPQNLRSGNSVYDILELDMYGCGLGCQYHEMRDIAYRCSKARILQWMSNICKYISSNVYLRLIPGKHVAIELQNGSKLMLENSLLPLSTTDLILTNYT
ncbi:protein maelstrom isoform X2 [Myzus persicae]|uniref:protein maelstrom isoform X2 n=1 Tax=Myzus persicae TaxID=13164 RepID=UPI000B9318EB|nr:protein maelstrom isoform X2 [Myzus persicae]